MRDTYFLGISPAYESQSWPPATPVSVKLFRASNLNTNALTNEHYRVSPIFPLDNISPDAAPDLIGSWCISFHHFERPFPALGGIRQRAPEEDRQKVWFSVGAASCLVFSRSREESDKIVRLAKVRPSASESWLVHDGVISDVDVVTSSSKVDCPADLFDLPDYSALPADLGAVIDEFFANIQTAWTFATIYRPGDLDTLRRFSHTVVELIEELLWISNPTEHSKPQSLTYITEDVIHSDDLTGLRLIHQRTDQLVQINSILSYVVSQAYYGFPPLMHRSTLIRRHALLGVATAQQGLTRIVRSIEAAFAKYPIEDAIRSSGFQNGRPLPSFSCGLKWDPRRWDISYRAEHHLPSRPTPAPLPRLSFFSGRLGFRETQYSTTAALQVISSGETLAWHLLTMTHEVLHSHVRNLLVAIFEGDSTKPQFEAFSDIYDRFSRWAQGEDINPTVTDSVRSIILIYCCMVPELGSLTNEGSSSWNPRGKVVRGNLRIPVQPDLEELLEQEYRNISEILVHVLDLHYFYDSQCDLYIKSIWTSWAVVPGVLRDMRQYILRSLLAVATTHSGSEYDRFELSLATLLAAFRDYPQSGELASGLVDEVIALIDDDSERNLRRSLVDPFLAGLRLADLARHVLYSGQIQECLFASDPLVTSSNGVGTYSFADGDFVNDEISSIPTFLLWRLVKCFERSGNPAEVERLSAWALIACA